MADMSQRNLIRVFLSSTFRDMSKEREYLNKVIFPEIRQISRTRGVEFSAIDLRWGVTETEAEQGDVISICLEEIDRCKPFFLGFLGERYGWSPTKDDVRYYKRLTERFPITQSCLEAGLSVTEMEILHGVLERSDEVRASFYQRSTQCTELLAQLESHSVYYDEDTNAQSKLQNLKKRIRNSNYPLHHYDDVEMMGQQVKRDILTWLDELYPESEIPDPIQAEKLRHRAYAIDRIAYYLANDAVVKRLNDFFNQVRNPNSVHKPLLLTGPSGRGKSALLSYWITTLTINKPDHWVIEHYAGVSNEDNAVSTLTRIINEIRLTVAPTDTEELPRDFDLLCEAFYLWLDRIPSYRPLLLVIDAINQISAPNLRWIPTSLPPHVICVMSALPSEQEDWLIEREVELYEIPALSLEVRRELAQGYLARYRKKLSQSQLDKVIKAKPCESPLFLTTVLAELVIFGSFERLSDYIDYLVSSDSLAILLERMINRFEDDYGPKLTWAVLTALWASKAGLSEDELLGISQFPLAEVSKVTLALDQHLKTTGGMIQFSHNFMEVAIKDHLFKSELQQKQRHQELADWFKINSYGKRRAQMLYMQHSNAENWNQIYLDLCNNELGVEALKYSSKNTMYRLWLKITSNLGFKIDVAYEQLCNANSEIWCNSEVESLIAALLAYAGRTSKFQLNLYQKEVQRKRETYESTSNIEDLRDLSNALVKLGDLYQAKSDLDNALIAYSESIQIDVGISEQESSVKNERSIYVLLSKIGDIAQQQDKFTIALESFQKSLNISRKLIKNHPSPIHQSDLAYALDRVGGISEVNGQVDDAFAYYNESLSVRRTLVNQRGTITNLRDLAYSLRKVGDISFYRGKFDEGYTRYSESLNIRRTIVKRLGTPSSLLDLSVSLICIGEIDEKRRRFDDALEAYNESISIREHLVTLVNNPNNQDALAISLCNAAKVYKLRGELSKSKQLFEKSLSIYMTILNQQNNLKNLSNVSTSLTSVGDVANLQGDFARATEVYAIALKARRRIAKALNTPRSNRDLFIALNRSGFIAKSQAQFDKAHEFYKECLTITRNLFEQRQDLNSKFDLTFSLYDYGDSLRLKGDLEQAFKAYEELFQLTNYLFTQHNSHHSKLAYFFSLKRLSYIHYLLKEYTKSELFIADALNMYEQIQGSLDDGDRIDLFYTSALIREQTGMLEEAKHFIVDAIKLSTSWCKLHSNTYNERIHDEIKIAHQRIINQLI